MSTEARDDLGRVITSASSPGELDSIAPPGQQPLVLSTFPSFDIGGAQTRFVALANRFGPRWRHVIASLDGRTGAVEKLRHDVPFAVLVPPLARGLGPLAPLHAIRRLIRRIQPDVLITSNWGSIDWVFANLIPPRTRHLHTEDGFGPDEWAAQKPRRILARRVALRWSTTIVPSGTLLRAAREIWSLPPSRLRYIPNGLDVRRFRPDGPVAALVLPGDGPLIGTVAALRPEKNLSRLLRACDLLKRDGLCFRLLVIGDGPERAALAVLARELDIADRTLFAGHVADPAAMYRALDLFALSSDTEQMPFSVMEAMASGLAVASTDVGDVRRMLAPENLPCVVERDDVALTRALRSLVVDASLRARLGAANRAKAERDYNEEAMFRAYAALIDGPEDDTAGELAR